MQTGSTIEDEARARVVHRDFLAEYGLPMSEVPLLRYDSRRAPGKPHFEDISRSDASDAWLERHSATLKEL